MSLTRSFIRPFEKKPAAGSKPYSHLQEAFPSLNEAAGDFLRLFSDNDFQGDLTLAAQMAGLKMLRSSGVTLGG